MMNILNDTAETAQARRRAEDEHTARMNAIYRRRAETINSLFSVAAAILALVGILAVAYDVIAIVWLIQVLW